MENQINYQPDHSTYHKNKRIALIVLIISILIICAVGFYNYFDLHNKLFGANSRISPTPSRNSVPPLKEMAQTYRALPAEEKQNFKFCVLNKIGKQRAIQVLDEIKANNVQSADLEVLNDCLSKASDTEEGDPGRSNIDIEGYSGELVKPGLRDEVRWGTARCNDGTPFAFKIEKPIKQTTSTWIIYFQGGGFCDDNALNCAERGELLTTTLAANDGQKLGIIGNKGFFDHDPEKNPYFYNANKVYAHYCSSDAWSGNTTSRKPSSADSNGWYYSGKVNARAMMEILKESYGLDDNDKQTKILFTGGSAGCMGANVNAETAVELFPKTAKDGRLKLISDGCFAPEFDNPQYRLGESEESMKQALIKAYDFWGSSINSFCEKDQKAKGNAAANCFMGSTLYRYLTHCKGNGLCLPNLIQYSSIDHWAVTAHNIDPEASTQNTGLELWREQVLTELNNPQITWLFSGGNISYHTLGMKDEMYIYGPTGGPTFAEVAKNFWEDGEPQKIIFGNE